MAFYKLPAAKNQSKYAVSFWQLFTAFILSLLVFYDFIPLTNIATVLYGSLWGLAFLCLSLLQMKALKEIDTNMLYPITTSLSLVASVLFGIMFFKDHLSWLQILGMVLVVAVVYLFSYKGKKLQYSNEILIIGLGIIFLSAFGKIIQKFAAGSVDIHALQIYQYLSAAFFSLILYALIHRKEFKKHIFSHAFISGIMIGIPSFLGGYMWLLALTKGPFSLVASIRSLYILITAITAYLIFKEKLTLGKSILIVMAIIATVLIKIG
jgi:drug/metabolite transporter (DMT)-like permease